MSVKRKSKSKKINKREYNQLTVAQRKRMREGKLNIMLMNDLGQLAEI